MTMLRALEEKKMDNIKKQMSNVNREMEILRITRTC